MKTLSGAQDRVPLVCRGRDGEMNRFPLFFRYLESPGEEFLLLQAKELQKYV